jgi:hypothetical protein
MERNLTRRLEDTKVFTQKLDFFSDLSRRSRAEADVSAAILEKPCGDKKAKSTIEKKFVTPTAQGNLTADLR